MQPALPNQKSLFKRQIPTILGLTVLVVALVAGLLFFSQGTGVFAPRATPQTTPKTIKVSNVTDNSFTVSFLTDEATPGFIKYGTEADNLSSQASDDRDQLSGSVGNFTLHHITVRGLQPNTQYYYTLGTGSQAQFDNEGSPFNLKTAQRAGSPSAAKTIYGNVVNNSGGPAEGSIVFVTIDGVGELSSLVKGSGSWAIPLSNARKIDGSGYAEISDDSSLTIRVQGPAAGQTAQITTTVAQAQPVESISFGQTESQAADTSTTTDTEETTDTTTDEETLDTEEDTTGVGGDEEEASASATLASATSTSLSASSSATTASSSAVVDLTKTTAQTVTTSQPTITGKAAPNVVVTISVHSETEINQQLTTDANGNFVLDISQLEDELEPGTHTVTYSYVDPTTGKTVTKTQTFTVKGTSTQLAAATTTSTSSSSAVPFGSGNPVPIGGATQSATATKSATVSARTSQPSTASGVPVSGSVGTTLALIIGGLFFTITGAWSFWVSQQLKEEYVRE
jgi:hypothetical protein